MLRKTTAAVVLAGALALGTASATSLGTFDDISFAASSVDLTDCTAVTDVIDLLPTIPSVNDTVGSATVPTTGTFLLETLDISSLVTSLPAACNGLSAALVIIGDHDLDLGVATPEQVMETITAIDLLNDDLTAVPVTNVIDVAQVTEVRVVVSSEAP